MSDFPELPPIADQPLSVLLIARDAAADLAAVLGGWLTQLESLKRPYEIILVDDGSRDGTGGLATFLAGRLPNFRVFVHAAARGFGAALRTGLAAARYPLLFYTTCDRSYQPADLKRLLDQINKVHLITGFRAGTPVPRWLRWLGRVYRGFVRVVLGETLEPLPGWLGWSGHGRHFLARWLFGVRLRDVDSAFRLFRRSIFDRIPIQSDGPFAAVEILAKANFMGHLMSEEPVAYGPPVGDSAWRTNPGVRQFLKEARLILAEADFGPAQLSREDQSPA